MVEIPKWLEGYLTERAKDTLLSQLEKEEEALKRAKEGYYDDLFGIRINKNLPHDYYKISKYKIRFPSLRFSTLLDYYHDRDLMFGVLVFGFKVLIDMNRVQVEPTTFVCPTGFLTLRKTGIIRRKLDVYVSDYYRDRVCYEDHDYMDVLWFGLAIVVNKEKINGYIEKIKTKCGVTEIVY